jgi:hypothetical protein
VSLSWQTVGHYPHENSKHTPLISAGHWEEEKWYYIGTQNAGRFMRALGWVQFLADCASVWCERTKPAAIFAFAICDAM